MQIELSNKIFILKPDASEPESGLFAVTLHKKARERALCVMRCKSGEWAVCLDGSSIASPSHDWKVAFGRLAGNDFLTGRRVSVEEYKSIIKGSLAELESGRDLSKPVDFSTITTRFMKGTPHD